MIMAGLVAVAFALSGCADDNGTGITGTTVIDTRKEVKPEPVNLTDIADDLRIIRLETVESSLLRYFDGFVGERHIVSVGQAAIHHFSSSGTYHSMVARRGNGPGEFNQIDAWCVDRDEKYLLYHDMGRNQINRYDLERRVHTEPIPFQSKGSLNRIMVYDDSLLLVMPGNFGTYGYLFFFQTFDGIITGGIKKEDEPHPGAWAGMHSRLSISDGGRILVQPSDSDTVLMVIGDDLVPWVVFISGRPERYGDMTKGLSHQFLRISTGLVHFIQVGYEKTISQGNAMMNVTDFDYMIYDISRQKAIKADPLYYDLWGYWLELPGLVIQDGGFVHCPVQATDFRRILRQALDSSGGPVPGRSGRGAVGKEGSEDASGAEHRAILESLHCDLSDDDNPVIISGRLIR